MQFVVAGLLGLLIMAILRMTRRRRHRYIFGSRNGTEQMVTALLVVPLIASGVVFIASFAIFREIRTALIFASITAGFGYLGSVVLGLTVYCVVRWQNLTLPDAAASAALIARQLDLPAGQTRSTRILRLFSQ